ncbi:hypothetical protein [Brevibacillus sp. NRS-1366]|uniref:hypothetical protein n=1 Tax=Brevibacillus sp. NRS-1366 TaxID=3233899 RepID=UPI003D1F7FAB
MITKGYKYITWDIGEENAEVYIEKINLNQPIHHKELSCTRGREDKEFLEGIYICSTLEELFIWVKEILDEGGVSAIEILEVTPIGIIKQKHYENGRVAFVVDEVEARIVSDIELPSEFHVLFDEYFQ